MTDSFVAVPPDSTGKKLRTDYSTSSGGTVVHTEYVRADHSVIVSPTAGSFNVTVANPGGFRNVTSNTAASFNVTIGSARVDHSVVVSPTAGSFNVTVANPGGFRNVTSNTAGSFLNTSLLPGYARITSVTAASALVTAKSLSLTAGSFNATVAAPGYVRAQNPTTSGSFLAQVNIPGILRLPATRGSTVVSVDHSQVVSTTAGSFLAQVSVPAFVNVKGPTTRGSTIVQADHSLVVSTSNASFLAQVSIPAFVNVKGPTTRGSTVVQADHSQVVATNASFSVSVPGILRYPTTRGSTVDAVDHSAIVSVSAASFLIGENVKVYSTAWPRASATGVYSFALGDTLGRNVSIANAPPGMTESTTVLIPSPNTAAAIFNAVAGMRHYITDLQAWNQSGTAVFLRFVSGITGPVAAPTGKGMFFLRSTASNIAGMVDQDFLTPIFTNVGATFAVYGNLALSSTTRLRVFASGYQSPV